MIKWYNLEYIFLKFALSNVIVVRCKLLSFEVNFDKILLNKNIQKRIICIYNNDIAAARVELWLSSTNAKYAEISSTDYNSVWKVKKSRNVVSFKKNAIIYVICHVFMVDIKI